MLPVLPAWSTYATQCGGVRRLLVGFSGGVDSTVLLDLARQWSAQSGLPVLALHVNHQLSPHADHWQQHCQNCCEAWGVPFVAQTVSVVTSGHGLEAAARVARYDAFARVVGEGDLLLLGHHRDDQMETVLLRLFRGSGVLGLRGMETLIPWRGAQLLRPLLGYSKADLIAYAHDRQWRWIEDESNTSDAFDRNYLRHRILPAIRSRWPHLPAALERSAQHCAEAQQLLDERAHEDLLPRIQPDGGLRLSDAEIPSLAPARIRNLLRYWLRCQQLSLPSEVQLDQILNTVIPAAEDAMPQVNWPGVEIRRYRRALYALVPAPADPNQTLWLEELCTQRMSSGGELRVSQVLPPSPAPGAGSASLAGLRSGLLSLRFRQGGEACKLRGRPTRPLKKILQDSALPPWWRDRLPLIYVGDTLAVVPGIGVCEGFQAVHGEPAVIFDWQPPTLPQGWHT